MQIASNVKNQDFHNNLIFVTQNYPGFGESELFYSLTITTYSVGSIIASPLTGFLTLCLPYVSILLAGVFMHTASNLLYGLASHGWMILIARFLLGASFKFFKVSALTYISNKESDYEKAYTEHVQKGKMEVKVGDVQIKRTMFLVLALCTFLPAVFGPGKFQVFHLLYGTSHT